jgi:two-component system sensor histidine kinase KdpD
VLGARPPVPTRQLAPEQRQLLGAFASQAALAIERAQLAEQARQAEVLQAAERLQTALLNSISHDLRTPLVSILGALSSLQEDEQELDPANRRSLVDNAREETERLNRLVGNLLDITRIEAGALKVMREPCDVEDLVGAALEQLRSRLRQRTVQVDLPPDLPLVPMDFCLIEQVVVNLLDNALKYSPPELPIRLRVAVQGAQVYFEVEDQGRGLPPGELGRVFDKFYGGQQSGHGGGTGLGLSICKGFVEAHGGQIWLEQREGGGTSATFVLPLDLTEGSA